MCLYVFRRARICVCMYLDVPGYVFARPATVQLSSAAAVRFGTPCLTHRTQLTLLPTQGNSQSLPQGKNNFWARLSLCAGEYGTWGDMRARLSRLWPMCVCVWQSHRRRRCLLRKPVRKQGGWGLLPDQNRFGGVVRKKSNMGVGRPVGTGGGRGHPRHPQPLWRHTWKIYRQTFAKWALRLAKISTRQLPNFLCHRIVGKSTLLWRCGADEGAVRRGNVIRTEGWAMWANVSRIKTGKWNWNTWKKGKEALKKTQWGKSDPVPVDSSFDLGRWQH